MVGAGNNLGSSHHALIQFDLKGRAVGTRTATEVFDFQKAVFQQRRRPVNVRFVNAKESWNFLK